MERKSLVNLEVFLGKNRTTKERKDRVSHVPYACVRLRKKRDQLNGWAVPRRSLGTWLHRRRSLPRHARSQQTDPQDGFSTPHDCFSTTVRVKIITGSLVILETFLVDVSDIFNFFSARGRGRGSPRRREGGGNFLLKIPGGGGGSPGWVGAGGRGAGRVFAGNFGGGGAKYFFSGPKFPPSFISPKLPVPLPS